VPPTATTANAAYSSAFLKLDSRDSFMVCILHFPNVFEAKGISLDESSTYDVATEGGNVPPVLRLPKERARA